MQRKRMIIRNTVTGDPIDFYIETREKNRKRKGAVLERIPAGFSEARTLLKNEKERSISS